MCTVNIRGHEENFYEAEARGHEVEIEAEARKTETEAEAEAKWFEWFPDSHRHARHDKNVCLCRVRFGGNIT